LVPPGSLGDPTFAVSPALRRGHTELVGPDRSSGVKPRGDAAHLVRSLALVPVRRRGKLVAAFGVTASGTESDWLAQLTVVETVAALLEAALANIERTD